MTALAIEVLEFVYSNQESESLLLLDEPDVHIHPDLQRRLINFLITAIDEVPCQVVVSTHSTAILAASSNYPHAKVCFLESQQKHLLFKSFDKTLKKTIPAFGSHLISRVFRDCPVLLVEGEDDARIWSAATRSSNGAINFFPVVAGDKTELTRIERECAELLPSIYDQPICLSVRDGDGISGDLEDTGIVRRFRLACYAAENLLLTDETLSLCGLSTEDLLRNTNQWISQNQNHTKLKDVKAFADDFENRKVANIKSIRELILLWLGVNKPWEVLVGQVLAKTVTETGYSDTTHSMKNYLGAKVVEALNLTKIPAPE